MKEKNEITAADLRAIRSDGGQRLLEHCAHKAAGVEPIGNANLSEVLRFVKLGLIDGDGITPLGREYGGRL